MYQMGNWDLETETKNYGPIIRFIRKSKGMKQEVLAEKMNMTQQTVSRYESMGIIDDSILEKFAKALDVPLDTIKNYHEDSNLNISVNTMQDNSSVIQNYYPTFNTVDKLIELYERLLETEQEKTQLLEEVFRKRK